MKNTLQNTLHLAWRAGFGEPYAVALARQKQAMPKQVKLLFAASAAGAGGPQGNADSIIVVGKDEFLMLNKKLDEDSKQILQDAQKKMNREWVKRMAYGNNQLREKMTLFWHGHFACKTNNVWEQQQQHNLLRTHALGSFRTLVHAVAKDAAMLRFLNNQQNRKQHPNENFARELMELFTLGRGQYTEADIQQAARAFTGWQTTEDGNFVLRKGQHDDGVKTFLGRSGNFGGEDVINMILEKRECAAFVTRKLYRFMVNEVPNEEKVQALAQKFYESDYDINALLRHIFTAGWFYDAENIGNKIKSPIELLAGLMRTYQIEFENEDPMLFVQRILDQQLFNPPNVAGWPGGRQWIDSSRMVFRLKLPEVLMFSFAFDVRDKDTGNDDDRLTPAQRRMQNKMMMDEERARTRIFQKVKTRSKFDDFSALLEQVPDAAERYDRLSAYLLRVPPQPAVKQALLQRLADQPIRRQIFMTALLLMSLPEYQLA
jgi:uncharacterized protein (DUF1800 family)